jgi:hypothetical protein
LGHSPLELATAGKHPRCVKLLELAIRNMMRAPVVVVPGGAAGAEKTAALTDELDKLMMG